MIKKLSVATIWVIDQNESLRFYTEKLGFDIVTDVTNGNYRWLTIGLKAQPELEFQLAVVEAGPLFSEEEAAQLKTLVQAGKLPVGSWKTDDCQACYEAFTSRGVEFLYPPTDRPYGIIESVFKDNSGNVMVLVQDKR